MLDGAGSALIDEQIAHDRGRRGLLPRARSAPACTREATAIVRRVARSARAPRPGWLRAGFSLARASRVPRSALALVHARPRFALARGLPKPERRHRTARRARVPRRWSQAEAAGVDERFLELHDYRPAVSTCARARRPLARSTPTNAQHAPVSTGAEARHLVPLWAPGNFQEDRLLEHPCRRTRPASPDLAPPLGQCLHVCLEIREVPVETPFRHARPAHRISQLFIPQRPSSTSSRRAELRFPSNDLSSQQLPPARPAGRYSRLPHGQVLHPMVSPAPHPLVRRPSPVDGHPLPTSSSTNSPGATRASPTGRRGHGPRRRSAGPARAAPRGEQNGRVCGPSALRGRSQLLGCEPCSSSGS